MTTRFQISDKRGDAILLVTTEHEDPEAAHHLFALATQQAGLDKAYEAFSAFPAGPVAIASRALGATPVPQQPAYQPPAAPQIPAAAANAQAVQPGKVRGGQCVHGAANHRTGTNARGPWQGYFCPEPKGAPQCDPEFLR